MRLRYERSIKRIAVLQLPKYLLMNHSHDEELLEDIEELIPNPSYFDYELLYGIRRDLQKSLLNKQYRVRIYIPFGEQWLTYTLRRLKEWKNLKFVIKNIFYEIFR